MPFGRHVYKTADKVIAVSQLERIWILNNFKLPEEKVTYIPHPIKIPKIIKKSDDHNNFNICYLGRLDPWKRVDVLIDAFRILAKNCLKMKLTIIGDGPSMGSLRDRVGATAGVTFLGRVSHDKVLELLKSMDVLVLPSEIEVSPVVAYEAMASNVAVITTPVGDLSLLTDGKTCLFTKLNASCLAERISFLMENVELRKAIAMNGYRLVESKFEESKIINLYISLFANLDNY
jgi:glycosyltransferase involved in cell wall biosynthesis